MNQELIHVYFMPGMAANPSIFEHIKLPKEKFEIHWLKWKIPNENETIENYAKRMCEDIQYDNPVLLGVSFGGILVQEMAKHITLKRLIIVSSVKNKYELPNRMKLAKVFNAYKLAPTTLMSNVNLLAKFAFGKTVTKRIELYKKYLSVSDKKYLDWAIEQVVQWKQEKPMDGIIHIHGEKDAIFPVRHLKNYIPLKAGTHIMIINRPNWFNEHLPNLILTGSL